MNKVVQPNLEHVFERIVVRVKTPRVHTDPVVVGDFLSFGLDRLKTLRGIGPWGFGGESPSHLFLLEARNYLEISLWSCVFATAVVLHVEVVAGLGYAAIEVGVPGGSDGNRETVPAQLLAERGESSAHSGENLGECGHHCTAFNVDVISIEPGGHLL